jgi:hypothetical protein
MPKVVRCPDCNDVLYVFTKQGYIVGNLIFKHGFSAECTCGYEFNSEWIKKENDV